MRRSDEEGLDALLQAFRDACPDPEASANFMPGLWQKIEARQRFTFSLGRMASAFVTAALAASLALGVYLSIPSTSPYYSDSYVDNLAAQDSGSDVLEPVHYEMR